jgi:1-acyl-sn-glycerol-3-phosphate acyltransferase
MHQQSDNIDLTFRGNPDGNAFTMALASGVMRLFGWRPVGILPDVPKFVVIGAPHTSNWDFILSMVFIAAVGVRAYWMAKHTLFRFPYGWFFSALGGVPINRTANFNVVEQAVQEFSRRDKFILGITPEGTRSRVDYWKSGFYYIARAAKAPILLCFFDYRRKQIGFGPLLWPGEDPEADLEIIRAFYADKTAKHPEKFGEIRFRPRS